MQPYNQCLSTKGWGSTLNWKEKGILGLEGDWKLLVVEFVKVNAGEESVVCDFSAVALTCMAHQGTPIWSAINRDFTCPPPKRVWGFLSNILDRMSLAAGLR
eukprot:TRINITY_DN11258_c0_g1_i3.p1 TRINITY_DN11258_c0_g1~~TRINITY_DN11258_c0_g1_i3.p1  ORF type:complete len:102 (-),score=7.80 TRINITY_DN11258_c0_g1_i3:32-337(-)